MAEARAKRPYVQPFSEDGVPAQAGTEDPVERILRLIMKLDEESTR
jgi:hypothetical protein